MQRTCAVCGRKFYAVKEVTGKHNGKNIHISKYCSKDCWNIRARVIKNCLFCGKEIITFKSVDKKYCNQKCRDEDYKNRFKGDKSHLWKGGKTSTNKLLRTSSEFRQWRKSVFERDNYTCILCGARCGNGKKIELHPDHIKRLADFPELVFDVNNGRTLCAECHRKTDTWGNGKPQIL